MQPPVFPPFLEPFPIDAPGVLLTPDPNYPEVVIASQGLASFATLGDYENPAASLTVSGTATVSTPVPEPDSILLLGIGLLGLLGYRLRQEWGRPTGSGYKP
jgi:hypothetical protein